MENQLDKSLDRISHRGPDSRVVWVNDDQTVVSRFRPLYYKDKSDATNAQYTRVLIYATCWYLSPD